MYDTVSRLDARTSVCEGVHVDLYVSLSFCVRLEIIIADCTSLFFLPRSFGIADSALRFSLFPDFRRKSRNHRALTYILPGTSKWSSLISTWPGPQDGTIVTLWKDHGGNAHHQNKCSLCKGVTGSLYIGAHRGVEETCQTQDQQLPLLTSYPYQSLRWAHQGSARSLSAYGRCAIFQWISPTKFGRSLEESPTSKKWRPGFCRYDFVHLQPLSIPSTLTATLKLIGGF